MDDLKEEWRPLPEYEELYECSNLGRCRSMDRETVRNGVLYHLKSKILKESTHRDGRKSIIVWKNGDKQVFMNYQLIWIWHNNRLIPNGYHVHHLNHNSNDNSIENLELIPSEIHRKIHGKERAALLGKPVQQLTMEGKLVATYNSPYDAARQTGLKHDSIYRCCNGGRYFKGKWVNHYSYKGYKWQYA